MQSEVVRVPRINANEDELEVVDVAVSQGDFVEEGDRLCTFESTKATLDFEAPRSGYVRRLQVEPGDRIAVGAPVCALTQRADQPVEWSDRAERQSRDDEVRATRRARELIDEYELDVATLDCDGIITEHDVVTRLERDGRDLRAGRDRPEPSEGCTPALRDSVGEPIVIYGAGGHARVIIDLIREGYRGLEIVGIVDDADDPPGEVLGVPVVGDARRFGELRDQGVELAALGIGAVTHNALRAELFRRLVAEGFRVPNLIHPDATVAPSVQMGRGNQIFGGAIVSSSVRLGDNGIVNANAVVSHDCRVEDHVHLTPNATLAGGVRVGQRTVVGMGVTVYLGVDIGADVVVANGRHILEDVDDDTVVRA